MTQKNKLIVGAVVVLGAYYLYSKNKTKNEVADLKNGANEVVGIGVAVPNLTAEIEAPMSITKIKSTELNFAGNRGNSMSAQYFR
jgi:hypothetical protein